jgi:hypothetical protein
MDAGGCRAVRGNISANMHLAAERAVLLRKITESAADFAMDGVHHCGNRQRQRDSRPCDRRGTMGSIAWKVVLLIAAVVAVIRPIYAPGKKIEQLTRQEQGYTTNYFALKKLAHTARQTEQITDDSRKSFDTIFDRHVQLSGDDEFAPDGRLLERCRTKTLEELPRHRYWWPFTSLMPEFGQSEQTPTQKVNSPKSVVIQPRIPSAGDLTRPAPRAPIADTSTS